MMLMSRIKKIEKKLKDKGLFDGLDNSKVTIEAADGLFLFDNCKVSLCTANFKKEYKKHYRKIEKISANIDKYAMYDCKHCKAENIYIDGDNENRYSPFVFAGIIPDNFNYDVWEEYR